MRMIGYGVSDTHFYKDYMGLLLIFCELFAKYWLRIYTSTNNSNRLTLLALCWKNKSLEYHYVPLVGQFCPY